MVTIYLASLQSEHKIYKVLFYLKITFYIVSIDKYQLTPNTV